MPCASRCPLFRDTVSYSSLHSTGILRAKNPLKWSARRWNNYFRAHRWLFSSKFCPTSSSDITLNICIFVSYSFPVIYETNCSNRIFRNFFFFFFNRKESLLTLGLFKIYYAIAKSEREPFHGVLLLLRQVKEFPFFVIMHFIMFKIILFIVECVFSFIAIVEWFTSRKRVYKSKSLVERL